jgi:hypothetical protein
MSTLAPGTSGPLEAPLASSTESTRYPQRFAYRFLTLYSVLFFFPSPLDAIPFTDSIWSAWKDAWTPVFAWSGKHLLSIDRPIVPPQDQCGDTIIEYVRVAVFAFIALVGASAWALRPSRPASEQRLMSGLRVYARYVIGFQMLTYGICKLFPIQFNALGPWELETRVGDTTLMALLWYSMGAAPMYAFFGGAAEMLGGLLMFFRQTTLLGSLIVFGVMSNVVLLNYTYDICVKLFSSHLLAFVLFLLAPHARWLFDSLIQRSRAVDATAWLASKRAHLATAILKVALIAGMAFACVQLVTKSYASGRLGPPKSPLSGVWKVESFERGGAPVAEAGNEDEPWKRVLVSGDTFMIFNAAEQPRGYAFDFDSARGVLSLTRRKTQAKQTLHVTRAGSKLLLEGAGGNSLRVSLQQKTDYRLLRDRIDWIHDPEQSR